MKRPFVKCVLLVSFILSLYLLSNYGSFAEDSVEQGRRIKQKLEYAWQQQFFDILVVKVQSGDMVRLANGEMVCLIGIDTPETNDGNKIQFDSKFTGIPVEVLKVMGNEAMQFLIEMIEGRNVRIEFDEKTKDQYGNLLGYVFLLPERHDGKEIFINAEVIKRGYTYRIDTAPNLRYQNLFDDMRKKIDDDESQIWKKWRR